MLNLLTGINKLKGSRFKLILFLGFVMKCVVMYVPKHFMKGGFDAYIHFQTSFN